MSKYYEIKQYNEFKLPTSYPRFQSIIENLQVYDDDIWMTSFPRSGTTWAEEMIWCITNKLDFNAAQEDLNKRFPFLDFAFHYDNATEGPDYIIKSLDVIKKMKRPRLIKTHLPWNFLPKEITAHQKRPKIFHVIRNPKDVSVSLFHFKRLIKNYKEDFGTHIHEFLNAKGCYQPFSKNVLSYWRHRNDANMFIIRYEDMQADLRGVVENVARFLDVTLTDHQINALLQHLSIAEMKVNPAVNQNDFVQFLSDNEFNPNQSEQFIRAGKRGGFDLISDTELTTKFDAWMKREFCDTGLVFN